MNEIGSIFPDGRTCKWLKEDLDTGVDVGDGVFITGTCRLFGDVVYNLTCKGCSGYRRWRG